MLRQVSWDGLTAADHDLGVVRVLHIGRTRHEQAEVFTITLSKKVT